MKRVRGAVRGGPRGVIGERAGVRVGTVGVLLGSLLGSLLFFVLLLGSSRGGELILVRVRRRNLSSREGPHRQYHLVRLHRHAPGDKVKRLSSYVLLRSVRSIVSLVSIVSVLVNTPGSTAVRSGSTRTVALKCTRAPPSSTHGNHAAGRSALPGATMYRSPSSSGSRNAHIAPSPGTHQPAYTSVPSFLSSMIVTSVPSTSIASSAPSPSFVPPSAPSVGLATGLDGGCATGGAICRHESGGMVPNAFIAVPAPYHTRTTTSEDVDGDDPR